MLSVMSFRLFAYDNSSPLDINLSLAKTSASGRIVEDESGKRFFIFQKRWTLAPVKIYLPDEYYPYAALKSLKVGNLKDTYLFLALNKTDANGILKPGNTKLLPISSPLAKNVIKKLVMKKDFIGEINPSWQFCETDLECVQAKNQCGNLIGVNTEYEKDYLNFIKFKKLKVDCSKSEISKASASKCLENFCS